MSRDLDTVVVLASRFDVHADAIVSHCNDRKIPVARIDVGEFWPGVSTLHWSLTGRDGAAILEWKGRRIDTDSVRSIYCRDFAFAKCDPSADIAAQLACAEGRAALYGFFRCLESRYWMNPPWYDEMADNKLYQMQCARNIDLAVPKTLVTNDREAFKRFYEQCNGEVIIKQLSEICLIDDSELNNQKEGDEADVKAYGFYTNRVRPEHLDKAKEIAAAPCLFQEHIPKKADIRVTVVGDQLFSALIDSQGHEDSRIDFRQKPDLPVGHFTLPEPVAGRLLNLIHSWHLEFAACDFVLTPEDELVFLEANVEGNWLWIEHELDLPISECIIDHLTKMVGRAERLPAETDPAQAVSENQHNNR